MNHTKEHMIQSVETALNYLDDTTKNNLPPSVLGLEGMSGPKYRQFANHLIRNVRDVRYLEIGIWHGSTSISAFYNNRENILKHWLIDNWCEFGGPKDSFLNNFQSILGYVPNAIEKDCFDIKPSDYEINDVNIYFYDGWHTEESQRKAVEHYASCLTNPAILMVDDYDWAHVKNGTQQGLESTGLKVEYKKEIVGNGNSTGWHNGCVIMVVSK